MKKNILNVVGLFFLLIGYSFSQTPVPVTKITKDSISIKWLPNNFEQFKSMLTKDVSVKRMEVKENTSVDQLDFSSAEVISIDNGKKNYDKLEEEEWFQESFELLLSPYFEENTEEIEENYAFALSLVANLSKPRFQFICGNIFIDKDFDRKKTYAYEITTGGESLRVLVDPSQITNYGSVDFELSLDKKKTIDIEWESKKYEQDYFGFEIKKAIKNKKDLSYLKDEAYLPFRSSFEKKGTNDFVRDDSLIQGEYHYYSISGIDLFGHEQPSDIVKKIYVPKLTNAWIQIDTIEADGFDRNIKTIVHPTGEVSDIHLDKLDLYRSKKRESGYELIKSTDFDNSDTLVNLSAEVPIKTGDAYYYKIIAFNSDKDSVSSLPHYFFTLDQEPPSPVKSLSGKIDSTGIVDLKWEAPEDNDLLGYRVFRANAKHEEFTEKTKRLDLKLNFRDTLSLDNLTPEIYYFVISVDSNYNNSIHSDTILLIKPDTIPPIPAVLKSAKRVDTVVSVNWINSTSADLKSQALIRTNKATDKVDTILRWSDSTSTFTDLNAFQGNYNRYQIITWDKSLNSSLSNDFEIFYEPGYRRNIDSFQVEVLRGKKQIKLDWKRPTDEVFSYKIFKGSSKDDLSLLKTIENPLTTTFSDIDISINNQYFYAIKYITKDGIHSIPLVKKVIY